MNPQVFATRVWRAELAQRPLATFSQAGYRDSLLRRAAPGALLCFVGTKNKNTQQGKQGKLIAIAEFGVEPVDAESILLELAGEVPLADSSYKDGKFRWPYALCLIRAWQFDEFLPIEAVIGRQLKSSATPGAEELSPDEAQQVLNLPRHELVLPQISAIVAMTGSVWAVGSDLPTVGLPPFMGGFAVNRTARNASVYVFRFGETDIFKVGWANDVGARLRDVNSHVPTEVTGAAWKLFLARQFDDPSQAYQAEQEFLRGPMSGFRTIGERVRVTAEQLRSHWLKMFADPSRSWS